MRRKRRPRVLLVTCLVAVSLYLLARFCGIPLPVLGREWAVGVYAGATPLTLGPVPEVPNPVLTAKNVTDARAEFLADPFLVREEGQWFMFFEVFSSDSNQGDIGLARSEDALRWQYSGLVLDEPFHLSYPFVFRHNGTHYMIPESIASHSVRMYRAAPFPRHWVLAKKLMDGDFTDPTILYQNDLWWLFLGSKEYGTLHLFFARDLFGQWKEHPASPVIKDDRRRARPGGRPIKWGTRLFRVAQDDYPHYGVRIRLFEITTLTESSYEEVELPLNALLSGSGVGWNANGMHHLDVLESRPGSWIAAVDGWRRVLMLKSQ